jgi:acyl dehydratase
VFEGDVLRTELTVDALHPLSQGGMVDLHAVVWADRGDRQPEQPVLDWRFVGLMA